MGTGINKIKKLLKEAGVKAPLFEFGNFYSIVFPRDKGLEKSSEKSSEKIMLILKKNSMLSAREIAELLKVTPRAIEKQIAKLKKQGKIKRIGSAKGGYWEVSHKSKS